MKIKLFTKETCGDKEIIFKDDRYLFFPSDDAKSSFLKRSEKFKINYLISSSSHFPPPFENSNMKNLFETFKNIIVLRQIKRKNIG